MTFPLPLPLPLVAGVLVGVGVFTVAAADAARRNRRVADLKAVLEAAYLDEPADTGEVPGLLARSGVLAERAFAGSRLIENARETVARSDWKITAGELLAISIGLGLGGGVVGLLAGSPVLAMLLATAGAFGPFASVKRSVARRRARFEAQFPDVLDLLAASLESGSGLAPALSLIVSEVDDPAASEFSRALAATKLGTPLNEALAAMAERLDSEDLNLTVKTIAVQQRTGGRLAGVLRTVADFMRGREELRRELSALTAEGRLSAIVLGALPFLIAGLISLVNPSYLTPLFTTAAGLVLVGTAGVLMAFAFVAMSRIVRIEV